MVAFSISARHCARIFGVHRTKPILQRDPIERHVLNDRASFVVGYVGVPKHLPVLSLRLRQFGYDCRRFRASLARRSGVKAVTVDALSSVVVGGDDEASFESSDPIAWHRSNSSLASAGILMIFPPRRKPRNLPLLTSSRTCLAEQSHSAASVSGV
jgi:hypothetical protein